MLVLSREVDQEIVITTATGEEITVKVVDIRSGKVRIGVFADPKTSIHRREVQDAIRQARSGVSK